MFLVIVASHIRPRAMIIASFTSMLRISVKDCDHRSQPDVWGNNDRKHIIKPLNKLATWVCLAKFPEHCLCLSTAYPALFIGSMFGSNPCSYLYNRVKYINRGQNAKFRENIGIKMLHSGKINRSKRYIIGEYTGVKLWILENIGVKIIIFYESLGDLYGCIVRGSGAKKNVHNSAPYMEI